MRRASRLRMEVKRGEAAKNAEDHFGRKHKGSASGRGLIVEMQARCRRLVFEQGEKLVNRAPGRVALRLARNPRMQLACAKELGNFTRIQRAGKTARADVVKIHRGLAKHNECLRRTSLTAFFRLDPARRRKAASLADASGDAR